MMSKGDKSYFFGDEFINILQEIMQVSNFCLQISIVSLLWGKWHHPVHYLFLTSEANISLLRHYKIIYKNGRNVLEI